MTTDFRVKLQELPVPEPRVELRERILASRATGARVVLPPDRRASRLTAPRAIAAAIVLTMLTWGVYSAFVGREEGIPSGAAGRVHRKHQQLRQHDS